MGMVLIRREVLLLLLVAALLSNAYVLYLLTVESRTSISARFIDTMNYKIDRVERASQARDKELAQHIERLEADRRRAW